MTTDVTNVQFAFMMIIRLAIRSPLMLVFAFVMVFMMGGKMAWIFLFVLPVLGAGLAVVIAKTIPLFRRVFKKYDKLNESIQENVKAMRVVKAFVREDYESKKFGTAAQDVCADFTRAERILALNGPLMQFCIYSVMVFVLSFGSYTIITSMGLDFDVGQLSALLTYSSVSYTHLDVYKRQRQSRAEHGQYEQEDPGHLAAHHEDHDEGKHQHERRANRQAYYHHERKLHVGDVRRHPRDEGGGQKVVYVLKREALDRVKDVVPEVPCQAAGGGRASQARQRAEKQRERRCV